MDSSSPPTAARTNWPVVLLVVGAGVVAAFQIGKAPAALPVLRADLGLSLVAAGWVISMFNVIGIALGMLIGAFADRLGHRRVVLTGLVLVAAASLAGAAAQGAFTLLASRFCEGLGFMMVVVACPTLIIRAAEPRDLKLAFGAWGAYMPAGTAAMMALSPLLMAPFGWRGLWIANAVLVLLFAWALFRTTRGVAGRRAAPGPASSIAGDIRDTLFAPGPPVLALAFASYTLQYLAVLGFLPTILVEREGLSQASAAVLTAIAIAANVPGNLAGGVLLHRGAPRWTLVAGASVVMALCGLGIYHGDLPLWFRYGLCVFFSLVCGILPAAVLGGAPVHAPRPQLLATTNGLIMQGSNLGQSIGPPAVAALAARVGDWHLSPLVLMASAAVGVALAFVLRALERRGPPRYDSSPA
jgi:MFS family permease